MTQGSNNPPAAVLELTEKQAKFLLKNCSKNMQFILMSMQEMNMSGILTREIATELVEINEQFSELRGMLRSQNIQEDDT